MLKLRAGLAAALCALLLAPATADAQGRHERGGGGGGGGGGRHQAAPAAPVNRGGGGPHVSPPHQFGGGGGGPARFASPPPQMQRFQAPQRIQTPQRAFVPRTFSQPQIQHFARPQPSARSIVVNRGPDRFRAAPAFRSGPAFERRRAARFERGRRFQADIARPTRDFRGDRNVHRLSERPATRAETRAARRLGALPARDRVTPSSRRLSNIARERAPDRSIAARGPRPFFSRQTSRRDGRNFTRDARRNGADGRRIHRHHGRGHFIAFLGPVFWPYASADLFDYAFLPASYDDSFWEDAYDDIFVSVFEPGVSFEQPVTASSETTASAPRESVVPSQPQPQQSGEPAAAVATTQVCRQATPGLTDFPFARIAETVRPNESQRAALDALKAAADKASGTLKSACPESASLTPPQRLGAAKARLVAMREAVRTVQPALETFYAALDDEQKARFNAMTPAMTPADDANGAPPANNEQALANAKPNPDSCKTQKAGISSWPIDRLDRSLDLTRAQETKLEGLRSATQQAVAALQTACPDYTPLTPTGRLDATAQRLDAIIAAIDAVAPALDGFYASLTDNQKARYGRLGRQASQE